VIPGLDNVISRSILAHLPALKGQIVLAPFRDFRVQILGFYMHLRILNPRTLAKIAVKIDIKSLITYIVSASSVRGRSVMVFNGDFEGWREVLNAGSASTLSGIRSSSGSSIACPMPCWGSALA